MIPHNLCVSFKSFSIHCRFRLIQVTHSKGNLTCNSDDIGLCGIIGIVLIQHSLKYFLEGVVPASALETETTKHHLFCTMRIFQINSFVKQASIFLQVAWHLLANFESIRPPIRIQSTVI